MRYRKIKKYKYQLMTTASYDLGYEFGDCVHSFISIKGRNIKIKKGYCWDGASGPAIDTKSFMIGSLVHDCLYQLIRIGLIENQYRLLADEVLYELCLKSGMNKVRALWVKWAVNTFGGVWINKGKIEPKIETVWFEKGQK